MKVVMLTREHPPHIYGGAGVVVGELTRALSRRMAVEVRCFREAMACQTPVVASAVGGILEVVEDDHTGLLVPPARPDDLAAAIRRLLDDRDLARTLGQTGRRRVEERFSWASVAERTEHVYADAIAGFSAGR